MRYVILVIVLLAGCTQKKAEQSAAAPVPASFQLIEDVVYGHDFGMALTFDVYEPLKPNGAGILLINSGGWHSPVDTFKVWDTAGYRFTTDEEMSKSHSWHVLSPKKMVENGYTVFEVRHGSEPKFEMPELVAHIRTAVRFITKEARTYGVDSTRIGLWGGSASGHLALLVGLTQESNSASSAIAAIAAFASPTDLERFVADNPKEPVNRPVLRMTKERLREYSPVHYASKDDPPTLIMHGNADNVVPIVQGNLMYAALQEASVTSEFHEFEATTHDPTLEQARRGVDEALAWFNRHLQKQK